MAFGNSRQWNWGNFITCFGIAVGQIAFGYPASIIATTLGQPAFLSYMKLVTPMGELSPEAHRLIGAMSGVFQAGAFFGIIGGVYVMDKWGRRAGVIYCSLLGIIGAAGLCGSINPAMFITFRFFAGAGSWAFLALTPIYTTELAPPRLRGFFVGMNGFNIGLGNAMASYVGLGFFFTSNPTTQWRGPLGLALVFPALMLILVYFLPESPRWLLLNGRSDEAQKIVMAMHSVSGDEDNEYAQSEFYQMREQAKHDRTLDASWMQLFRRPSFRKRLYLVCGFAFFGNSTAILVINNYGPTLYKALGYDIKNQLVLQVAWITLSIPGNFIGAALMDKMGRKPLMLIGFIGCFACLIVEAAVVASFASPVPAVPNEAALKAGVAALFVFVVFYSLGIDVAGVVFYSELFPNHLRSKGVAAAICSMALTSLVYLQAASTAFANIGWKFYLLFIILSFIGALLTWWFIPETKGIPIEEIAILFGDRDDVIVYSADIHMNDRTHQVVIDNPSDLKLSSTDPEGEGGALSHVILREGKDGGMALHCENA